MSNRRTVAVMETKEGPTLISGGASDLSAAQKSAAAARGLTVVPDFPGVHAEGTALNGAGQLGLTPTRGATSNIICPNCRSLINDLGGKITTSRTFKF